MSGYTRQEVAQRAGVDPDYVDRLVELGILTPAAADAFSPGDAPRARWLQSLERAGVPLEGMAAAVRDGALSFSFMDVTAFDRFAGLSGTTFQELSARTGIPLELLMAVRRMIGLGQLPWRWVGSRKKVPADAVELYVAVRDGAEVGSMTAFALLEALTQTEEGRVIMESLRRILAQTSEAPHVTEEDGT